VRIAGDGAGLREDIDKDKKKVEELFAEFDAEHSIDLSTTTADKKMDHLSAKLKAVEDAQANLTLDDVQATLAANSLIAQMDELRKTDAKVFVEDKDAKSKLDDLVLKLADFHDKTVSLKVHDKEANTKLDTLEARMNGIGNVTPTNTGGGGLLAALIGAAVPMASPVGAAGLGGAMGLLSAFAPGAVGAVGLGAVAAGDLKPVFGAVSQSNAALQAASQAPNVKTQNADLAKANAAFAGLDQAQVQAAKSLQTFEGFWKSFSQSLQAPVFTLFNGALQGIQQLLGLMKPVILGAAKGFATLEQDASKALQSPFWKSFFGWLGGQAQTSVTSFGTILGNLTTGFAALLQAFQPAATSVETGLGKMTKNFAAWAQHLGATKGFQKFLQYAAKSGSAVLKTIGDLSGLIGTLLVDMAPLGLAMVQLVGALANLLKDALTTNPVISTMVNLLLGAVTQVAQFVTWLTTAHPQFSQFLLDIAAVVLALVGLNAAGKTIVGWVSGLGKGIGSLIKVATELPTRIGLIGLQIQKMGSSVVSVTKNIVSFTASMVKVGIQAVATAAKITAQFIVSMAKAATQTIATGLAITGQFVVSMAKAAAQSVATAASVTGSFIVSMVKGLASALAMTASIVAQGVVLAAQKVSVIAFTVAQTAMTAGTALATIATTAFGVAMDIALGPVGLIILAVAALALGAYELVKHWGAVSKFFGDMWGDIKKYFKEFETWAGNFFGSLGTEALTWGENFVKMIGNGIMAGVHWVENAARSVANTVKSFLGFHSPTKEGPGSEADVWMPNLMTMLTAGIKAGTPQLQAALNNALAVPSFMVNPSVSAMMNGGASVQVTHTMQGTVQHQLNGSFDVQKFGPTAIKHIEQQIYRNGVSRGLR